MKQLLLFLLLVLSSLGFTQEAKKLKLWYNKPAVKWTEALPIGNGRIGAMLMFRDVAAEEFARSVGGEATRP